MTADKNLFDESVTSSKKTVERKIKLFFLEPLKTGFYSFAIFFSIILFVKLVNYLLSENAFFLLNIYDVMISVIGFSLGFILEFVLQLRKRIK